jgi:hypothetical protein
MTSSNDFTLIERNARTHKHDKKRRRHVDQSLQRQEKVAFKAKRHNDPDDEGEDY